MFHWKQEINSEFSDSPLRLQFYIIITGAAYFLFAFLIPTMSAMRRWLGISTILTFTYIIILLVELVKDGRYSLSLAYFVLEMFLTMILHCGSFVTIYMLCLNINLLQFWAGKSNKNKDYKIHGSKVDKVFNGFGAISAIIVCNTSGLLLEIQVSIVM